jgi:EAL domain-containing protein (putative c-di-GMP-specific phosphodiesterase class I)
LVARLGQDNNQDNGSDKASGMMIDALIGLAEQHGLVSAAEGIASAAQLTLPSIKGCVEGQGDLFGGPIAATEIPALLRYPSLGEAVA